MSYPRRKSRRPLALGLATALAALATLVPSAPASATPSASFYDPPANLPQGNGTLVRTEPMNLGASFTLWGTNRTLPGKATRIMYTSVDEIGQPVAVTGTYIEPTKRWSGRGSRPLVSYSEGTQGQGDACAPSKSLSSVVHVENGEVGLGYEIPSIYGFLNQGVAVVVTDYIGLGTPDHLHSYTDRLDMAHAVLDAARAALHLSGTSVNANSPIGLYGYSQGGGASAAAAELAPSYAPELTIVGAYAGAPPANLRAVIDSADNTALMGVLGYAINGLVQYRPELQRDLGSLLSEAGTKDLTEIKNQCIGSTLATFAFTSTRTWTASGESLGEIVDRLPTAHQAVADQRIGTLKPAVPVMVLTGTKDDLVDHGQGRQLALDWCSLGANVTYVPVYQPVSSHGIAINHLGPMITQASMSQSWLMDRLQGKRAHSNCRTINWMP